jgi:Fic family protein
MYLHEHDNWTTFRWDDALVTPLLTAACFKQGHLLGRMANLGFDVSQAAEMNSLVTEVIASSQIEGVALEADKVRSSVAKRLGVALDEADPDTRSVDGAVALTVDAAADFEEALTAERLFGWHAALFPTGYSGLHRIGVARYRTSEMQVVSGPIGKERVHYQAPPPEQVCALMDGFLAWFNGDDCTSPVIKAGLAHLWFLTVHPFDDGNGRIARALTEMLLARGDRSPRRFYSMGAQILTRRKDYYRILEHSQRGTSDVTAWLEWFVSTLIDALDESGRSIDGVLARATFWQRLEGLPLNERQSTMLSRLQYDFKGKLTTSKWAKMTKVSQDTATRDIADLIAKGILQKEPYGGRSSAYTLNEPLGTRDG